MDVEDEGEKHAFSVGDSTAMGGSTIPAPQKTAQFFACVFKTGAILSYLFCQWFSSSFILNFIVCVLLLSFDFWTVKNISGRLLVGLRWWNEVKDDGSNEWIFESRGPDRVINKSDEKVFWTALNVAPLIWFLFAFGTILKFDLHWFLICCVGMVLSGSNAYGYYKCQKDFSAKEKLTGMVQQSALPGMAMQHFASNAMSRFTRGMVPS